MRRSHGTREAPDASPRAPGGIPPNLSSPVGSLERPGCTIWSFAPPPATLHFDGGAIITSARLVPLFWGEFWRTASGPSANDVEQAIAQIVASPYLSEVAQYGFESLTVERGVLVVSPAPPAPTFSGQDVRDMVWDLIDDDRFPEPDEEGGRILYMVFAPQGVDYDDAEAGGAHGEAVNVGLLLDIDHAWVGWCNYGSIDFITEIFTHELVEMITDPEPPDGWTVEGMPERHNELVDICFKEMGFVDGYRVSAYYSDRLKACVVPAKPQQYSIRLSSTVETVSSPIVTGLGMTATAKKSSCFSGTYEWKLRDQQQRVTLTAVATGFLDPHFQWTVNGTTLVDSEKLGPAQFRITTSASTAVDALSQLTALPAHSVTAKVVASRGVLVLEATSGDTAGEFEVACTVSEHGLPSGYHASRTTTRSVSVAGAVRVMDQRFQQDLAKCVQLKSQLAQALIEEVVVPRIDKGDPPPVVLERTRGEVETEAEQRAQRLTTLAGMIEGTDQPLASSLRQLAGGVLSLAASDRQWLCADVSPSSQAEEKVQ